MTIPSNYKARSYQEAYHNNSKRFKIAVWHRRSGKSKAALNEQVRKSQVRKGIYYYFLPTYRQAKTVIWDALVKEHVPLEIVDKRNDSELAIYYKNGSIQRFVGCEDVDAHRGANPIDVVFDEYSEMNEKIWTVVIQPVLRENKGTATFIYTPKGQNHSWKLLQMAKENPEHWWTDVKTVLDTGAISKEELEEAKKNTPQAFYNQEYMCEFLESAGAFFRRIEENVWEGNLEVRQGELFKLGVDLAKYQDWTVLTPFSKATFQAGKQERFNQVDWNLQKARIEATARRYNNAVITVDSTGVGDPIAEDLERMGLNLEPREGFKFTRVSRRQLLSNLSVLLEQDKIKIPNDEGLKGELASMNFILKEGRDGKRMIDVQVPEGMTDDRIMSLALAVWEVTNPISIEDQNVFNLYPNLE